MARRIYGEGEVRRAVAEAISYSDALRRLGLQPRGGNFVTLKKLIERWHIATDHFDRNWAARARGRARAVPLESVLVAGSTYDRGRLKRRLLREGLRAPICEMCGQTEIWRGRVLALILDHINGVPDDHRLENLRMVCPNCAATLDTHCGRKNRLVAPERNCLRCGRGFRPRSSGQRYCGQACGSRHTNRDRRSRSSNRLVERPPYDQLRAEVRELGYLGTGRKYGVSDNAIRKWLRRYEYELSSNPRAGP